MKPWRRGRRRCSITRFTRWFCSPCRPYPGVSKGAVISFVFGIVVFSGSLYLLAVTNVRWLGAVTPVGGVGLLVGWAWLFIAAGAKMQG